MPVNSPYPDNIANASTLPDVQAHTDMVKASDMNNVRAFIRDITSAVGPNPQGSCADLVTRLSGILSADGKLLAMPNTLTVGPSGCQFTSIQDAIDSISDASETNPYNILIFPGTYNEQITAKAYVKLTGFIPHIVNAYDQSDLRPLITATSNPLVDCSNTETFQAENLKFEPDPGPLFDSSSGCDAVLRRCHIAQQSPGTPCLANTTRISFFFSLCDFYGKFPDRNLFELSGNGDSSFRLEARYCYSHGYITIPSGYETSTIINAFACDFKIDVTSYGLSQWITAVRTFWNSFGGYPFSFNCGEEAKIRVPYSTLIGSSGIFNRIAGSADPMIQPLYSQFSHEPPAYSYADYPNLPYCIGSFDFPLDYRFL